MLDLLKKAAEYAILKRSDGRNFFLGALGVRKDGCIVHAQNAAVFDTFKKRDFANNYVYRRFPGSHAEIRLTKKLDFGATLYVARVGRNGLYAMARPCECCRSVLKAFRVKKVFYTISNYEYGVWFPSNDSDRYCLIKA